MEPIQVFLNYEILIINCLTIVNICDIITYVNPIAIINAERNRYEKDNYYRCRSRRSYRCI